MIEIMKALKRLFWLIMLVPMFSGYGIIMLVLIPFWGGEKAEKKLPDLFMFFYNKFK